MDRNFIAFNSLNSTCSASQYAYLQACRILLVNNIKIKEEKQRLINLEKQKIKIERQQKEIERKKNKIEALRIKSEEQKLKDEEEKKKKEKNLK